MTTYNTGNPIGSTDPRDLYDNAQNLDTAMNTAATTWTDRLGNARQSWAGATGYQQLGDYAAGIQVTTYNQVIRASGEYWRAAAGTVLPYTTTGAGMPESGKFVSVGDAILRADLVDGDGSSLVGFQQSGTGSVVRTAQAKMREWVSVKDFGAVGNGVADDRAAIQLAINAAYGKTLYIPSGQYLLASAGAADAILQIANRIRIVADFGAALIYGAGIAATVDVIRVDPLTIADEGVEIDGLWIHEQSGTPARDVIRIRLDATHGLKKLRIHRCLFRSKGGQAINCLNDGELNANGLFFAQLTQSEFYGGITLEGLGDSNEISDCAITGPGIGITVTMLSPSAPSATSAKLGIRRNNITALGGAIVINRGRNVTIEDNNIEQIAALSGGYCIMLGLIDYDVPGVSTIRGNKIEPNDPVSECGGISLYRCKGTQIHGNQIGTSAKSGSYTIAVALGECSALRVFANDLQLSADCVGVLVDSLSKNVSYQRGKVTPFSTYTEISDSGIGTKGVAKTPAFENGWVNSTEVIAAVKFEKDDIGNVALSGAAGSGTLTANTVIFTLPQGFRPPAREVFSTYCYTDGGVTGRALIRVDPDGSVRLRYTSEGAAQLLEVGLSGVRFEGLDA